MAEPYLCPNCKTNRSRFNRIEQQAQAVKLNPQTGEIIEQYTNEQLEPFHLPYRGPSLKVQCGTCGLIEDERMFIQYGKK
ncbi:DNA alkylation repair protein [Alkalihalobacillus sp. BA299]|uniref:DNA alkylation repair protein n=1 Tax=Alkalihalobacillus sp. BA299 TaxID=2815938 RepID=UPI001ADB7F9F|nr:DNA alkylation repair protein [Alkalihalobacillus sp. BA299]